MDGMILGFAVFSAWIVGISVVGYILVTEGDDE